MARKRKASNGHSDVMPTVAFDYIKSPYFRAVRADGAIGALTPNGSIHFCLYSERPAIPRRIVHALTANSTLGAPIDKETISRGSIVREMDVDVFVTVDVAESIRDWLDKRIKEARTRSATTKKATGDK
jgi:hypothetical protein